MHRRAVVLFVVLFTGALGAVAQSTSANQQGNQANGTSKQAAAPAAPNESAVAKPKSPADILNYLVPASTAFPARLSEIPKADAIAALTDAQTKSSGAKANAIAFLLVVAGHDADANRMRLFDALHSCKTDPDNCDEDTVQYLGYLFEHGDKLVLDSMLDAVQFADGGLAETLGGTFGDVALNDTRAFVTAVSRRSAEQQRELCHMLTVGNGDGLSDDTKEQLESALTALSREAAPQAATAMMCLTDLKAHGSR